MALEEEGLACLIFLCAHSPSVCVCVCVCVRVCVCVFWGGALPGGPPGKRGPRAVGPAGPHSRSADVPNAPPAAAVSRSAVGPLTCLARWMAVRIADVVLSRGACLLVPCCPAPDQRTSSTGGLARG